MLRTSKSTVLNPKETALNGFVPLISRSFASHESTSSNNRAGHRVNDLNAFDCRSHNGVL
jgi:hypothetical protein